MQKSRSAIILCIAVCGFTLNSLAQSSTTVSGNVKNSATKEAIAAVSVVIKGYADGTYTDEKGNFKFTTTKKPPFALIVSSIGYEQKEIPFNGEASLSIDLVTSYALGQDIVVAASRVPERIMESPVSIKRINASAIRQAPASDYYGLLSNLKGVDVVTSSLTFKTISTRGFNSSGNVRLNQILDGMDNQAPGLNFPVGTVCGMTDLDVDNMELLEGASSALYGPGGTNGTLLINSKDPFKYQGVSAQIREGIMHVDSKYKDLSPYHDIALRLGQKVSDKFAFKLNAQYIWAKDWLAADTSNYLLGVGQGQHGEVTDGTRYTDANYNGVNVYGDETSLDINSAATPFLPGVIQTLPEAVQPLATALMAPFLSGPLPVSRTGYNEAEVVPDVTKNLKFSGGLYYNIKPGLQASFLAYWGSGNSVYTGSDRYCFKAFSIGQYKLELRTRNWFLRGYNTREDAGESYNATVTTQLFNEAWRPSYNPADPAGSWYPQFSGALVQGALQIYQQVVGQGGTLEDAIATVSNNRTALLNGARGYADNGRPAPGSSEFNQLFDNVRLTPIPAGGKFISKSRLYMYEGQYNLTDLLKIGNKNTPLEVLIGGNFKKYVLNTDGTIFMDEPGHPIYINEAGGYLQLSQRLLKDKLKLTASGRYDKNENFKGRFTPRFSAVITPAENHNIRLSYQTFYRFPTTQNQWIDLIIGGGVHLIGGLLQLKQKYQFDTNPVYSLGSFMAGDPKVQEFGEYKPESGNSFEVGYKGLINNKLLIDAYVYFAKYENFIGRVTVVQSSDGTIPGLAHPTIYSVSINSTNKVSAYGWGTSVQYLLRNNYFISANIFSDDITDIEEGFAAYYNAPKYRANLGFGNSGLGKAQRIGFNIVYRWQDAFFYESDFRQGDLPAFGVLDAQISYKLPRQKILFKLGGTNITNNYYQNAFGNPYIGGLYYISVGYNVF